MEVRGGEVTVLTQCPCFLPRCPFQGDNYRTRLIPMGPASPELPFPSHYQRFVISTFTFVEPPGMAVLEGEVKGIPLNPCAGNASVLGIPHPNTPKPTPGLTQLLAAQSPPVAFRGFLEAWECFLGVPSGLGTLFGDPQVMLAFLWLPGVHLLQRFRVPPGPAGALPALLPAGSALT